MKRLSAFLVLVITSAMLLAACGGGGAGGNGGSGGTSVTPGASGIKDAGLIGSWYTADGGSGYDFKDDFTISITNVGSITKGTYNITEGGNGTGKVQIIDGATVTTWNYKIVDKTNLEMTTDDGRSKKLKLNP